MPFDLAPPPKLWTPPKFEIIRSRELPKSLAEERGIRTKLGMLPGMAAMWGGSDAPPDATVVYTDRASSAADTSSYNPLATCDIGDAPASGRTRHVILAVWMEEITAGDLVLSSASIGGVAATVLGPHTAANEGTGVNSEYMTFAIAEVPTGTTAAIVLTFSGTVHRAQVAVFAAYDLQSSTPIATGGNRANNTAISINREAGGITVASCWAFGGTGITFTGVTEDADVADTIELAGRHGAGSIENAATGAINVTMNISGSLTRPIFIAGSWR